MTGVADSVRSLPSVAAPIVPATDLGNVVTLKHGSVYLLSDQFGDIHGDSRGLGLYHADTRILSCAAVRINGVRPALLQASMGGNYRGTVQLTNPDYMRNPGPDVEPTVALVRQSLGITRDRTIAAEALEERLRLVNYTEHDESVEVELDLDADHADIFEVRGYARPRRGELLPTLVRGADQVTFRYVGVDRALRLTHVAFSPDGEVAPAGADGVGASVGIRWSVTIQPGESRETRGRSGRPSTRCPEPTGPPTAWALTGLLRRPKRLLRPTSFLRGPACRPTRAPPPTGHGPAAPRAWTPTTNCSTRRSRAAWPTCGCS